MSLPPPGAPRITTIHETSCAGVSNLPGRFDTIAPVLAFVPLLFWAVVVIAAVVALITLWRRRDDQPALLAAVAAIAILAQVIFLFVFR